MNSSYWIAEGLLLWNSGWLMSRSYLRYQGIQSVLWPVTLVVRAIARDPLRDPAPQIADKARIAELEKELGIGQERPQRPSLAVDRLAVLEQPQERPRTRSGRSLARTEPEAQEGAFDSLERWKNAFDGFQ